MEQRSEEWYAARAGSVGASDIVDLLAKGRGVSRRNLMARLAAERLTGRATETYQSAAMLHGIEVEEQARVAYEFLHGVQVEQIGLIRHPSIEGTHASPDGLVGKDGVVEIKCPNTATHIDTLMGAAIDRGYILQMQWQMACSGRKWVDWISYDPRMPVELALFVRRVKRDSAMIADVESEVRLFLAELEVMVEKLRGMM